MAQTRVGGNDQPNGAHLVPQKKQWKEPEEKPYFRQTPGKGEAGGHLVRGASPQSWCEIRKSHHFTLSHSLPLALKEGGDFLRGLWAAVQAPSTGSLSLISPRPSPTGNPKLLGGEGTVRRAVSSFFGPGPSIQRQGSSCLSRAAQEPGCLVEDRRQSTEDYRGCTCPAISHGDASGKPLLLFPLASIATFLRWGWDSASNLKKPLCPAGSS